MISDKPLIYNKWTERDFKPIRDKFIQMKGRKEQLELDLKRVKKNINEAEQREKYVLKARSVLQKVAQETQEKLVYHISNIVNMALGAVLPDPYKLVIHFVERRNTVECDLLFEKDGEEMKPETSSGGGALDIAAFALRCVFWSFENTRPIIFLDEPFRFVSVDLQSKVGDMLQSISEKLGLQIIMVSHLPNIIAGADKIFEVSQVKGRSIVNEITI